MTLVYADLHIHVGSTKKGKPVKITASRKLTLPALVNTAQEKGLQLLGLVDASCSGVLEDLKDLAEQGTLQPVEGGGCRWGDIILFPGSEVELTHTNGRAAHFLAYFPNLEAVEEYAFALRPYVTNPALSTQRVRLSPDAWLELVCSCGGAALAAHAFTPHKGVYGNCVTKLGEMFTQPELLAGLELGLSADTSMAQCIHDTHRFAYTASSDAHSLATMGREFTVYDLPTVSFQAWQSALLGQGRGIRATHGMDPRLGKYYRSFCPRCQVLASDPQAVLSCPQCRGQMVKGVWDRIQEIADFPESQVRRPPYISHVPLLMLPGVGPAVYSRLMENVGSEIHVLYHAALEGIEAVAGGRAAASIRDLRGGALPIQPGGGGTHGRVIQ